MICSFLTDDNFCKYISNLGNNLAPYTIAIVWENIYFLTPYFKYVKKEKIHEDENVDELFDYCESNAGRHSFKKLRTYKIHSNYD